MSRFESVLVNNANIKSYLTKYDVNSVIEVVFVLATNTLPLTNPIPYAYQYSTVVLLYIFVNLIALKVPAGTVTASFVITKVALFTVVVVVLVCPPDDTVLVIVYDG